MGVFKRIKNIGIQHKENILNRAYKANPTAKESPVSRQVIENTAIISRLIIPSCLLFVLFVQLTIGFVPLVVFSSLAGIIVVLAAVYMLEFKGNGILASRMVSAAVLATLTLLYVGVDQTKSITEENVFKLYYAFANGAVGIVVISYIGKRIDMVVAGGVVALLLIVYDILVIYPSLPPDISVNYLHIGTSLLMVFLVTVIIFMLKSRNENAIKEQEAERRKSEDKAAGYQKIFESWQAGEQNGHVFIETARYILDQIKKNEDRLIYIEQKINDLNRENDEAMKQMVDLLNTLSDVRNDTLDQSIKMEESSSAIQQISATIKVLVDSVVDKQSLFGELANLNSGNANLIDTLKGSYAKNEVNSKNILQFSNMIKNIAEQTNLLSMNAAIEAAHAGESGKGFAVVAEEIRKLADDSGKNASSIFNVLKESQKDTQATRSIIEDLTDNSRELSAGVSNAVDAMSEMATGMKETETGSREMIQISEQMITISRKTREQIDSIQKLINIVSMSLKNIIVLSKEISEENKNIKSNQSQIKNKTYELEESGQDYIDSYVKLGKEMENINQSFKDGNGHGDANIAGKSLSLIE